MPIQKDPEGIEKLRGLISVRLRAARKGAGLSQMDAAKKIGHKGVTQISLAEDGQRIPTLIDLIKLADLYCVPIDFLVGRIDDPIAEAEEQSSGLLVRAVSGAISGCVATFTKAVSEHASVVMSGQREDRADLEAAVKVGQDLRFAIKRVRELNPKYDDLKGASRIEAAAEALDAISDRFATRVKHEKIMRDMIDNVLHLEQVGKSLQQFSLDFKYLQEESCNS